MRREAQLGDTVIVYDEGGNWRGLGTAWHLAEQGKRVTLVSSDAFIGKEIARTSADFPLRSRLSRLGVRMITENIVAHWHGDRATLRSMLDGSEQEVEASGLVMSTTNQAFDMLADELDDLETRIIGRLRRTAPGPLCVL